MRLLYIFPCRLSVLFSGLILCIVTFDLLWAEVKKLHFLPAGRVPVSHLEGQPWAGNMSSISLVIIRSVQRGGMGGVRLDIIRSVLEGGIGGYSVVIKRSVLGWYG